MGLLSFFKRKDTPSRPATSADAVVQARTKARQRLIGAVVLLGVGIIGFPLLFETQPRPIPVDIPIEIPRKEAAPPLVMPPSRTPASAARGPTPTSAILTEAADEPQAPAPASAASAAKAPTKVAAKEAKETKEPKAAKEPAPAKEQVVAAAPKPAKEDVSRAQALLEGKATAAADDGRFVVQVGAFSENSAAHEARVKVEKLGFRTYVQVVDTSSGKRIRVRIGPFASRDQAREAAEKIKASGLPAPSVLTL